MQMERFSRHYPVVEGRDTKTRGIEVCHSYAGDGSFKVGFRRRSGSLSQIRLVLEVFYFEVLFCKHAFYSSSSAFF